MLFIMRNFSEAVRSKTNLHISVVTYAMYMWMFQWALLSGSEDSSLCTQWVPASQDQGRRLHPRSVRMRLLWDIFEIVLAIGLQWMVIYYYFLIEVSRKVAFNYVCLEMKCSPFAEYVTSFIYDSQNILSLLSLVINNFDIEHLRRLLSVAKSLQYLHKLFIGWRQVCS